MSTESKCSLEKHFNSMTNINKNIQQCKSESLCNCFLYSLPVRLVQKDERTDCSVGLTYFWNSEITSPDCMLSSTAGNSIISFMGVL